MCCLTGSTRYFHVLVAALHKGCKSKLLAEGNCKVLRYGRGVVCGLLHGCDSRSGGAVLAQVRAMRKTDKTRRLFFCADVDDGLPLFALAMPLVSCSREKRLFGI